MPSDQLLKCFTITTLSLLDEQFLIFRFVYPLCGPFQYCFHGYGYLDARKLKRLRRIVGAVYDRAFLAEFTEIRAVTDRAYN